MEWWVDSVDLCVPSCRHRASSYCLLYALVLPGVFVLHVHFDHGLQHAHAGFCRVPGFFPISLDHDGRQSMSIPGLHNIWLAGVLLECTFAFAAEKAGSLRHSIFPKGLLWPICPRWFSMFVCNASFSFACTDSVYRWADKIMLVHVQYDTA